MFHHFAMWDVIISHPLETGCQSQKVEKFLSPPPELVAWLESHSKCGSMLWLEKKKRGVYLGETLHNRNSQHSRGKTVRFEAQSQQNCKLLEVYIISPRQSPAPQNPAGPGSLIFTHFISFCPLLSFSLSLSFARSHFPCCRVYNILPF